MRGAKFRMKKRVDHLFCHGMEMCGMKMVLICRYEIEIGPYAGLF